MREKHLYDYALIRVVPDLARGEFLNVGLIMFSKKSSYLRVQCRVDEAKLALLGPQVDRECLRENLTAFEHICTGTGPDGRIAALSVPERFRWLTAQRSATIQTSRPHAGFADDLDLTFEKLFSELVL